MMGILVVPICMLTTTAGVNFHPNPVNVGDLACPSSATHPFGFTDVTRNAPINEVLSRHRVHEKSTEPGRLFLRELFRHAAEFLNRGDDKWRWFEGPLRHEADGDGEEAALFARYGAFLAVDSVGAFLAEETMDGSRHGG